MRFSAAIALTVICCSALSFALVINIARGGDAERQLLLDPHHHHQPESCGTPVMSTLNHGDDSTNGKHLPQRRRRRGGDPTDLMDKREIFSYADPHGWDRHWMEEKNKAEAAAGKTTQTQTQTHDTHNEEHVTNNAPPPLPPRPIPEPAPDLPAQTPSSKGRFWRNYLPGKRPLRSFMPFSKTQKTQ